MITAEWIDGDWNDAYAVRREVFIREQNVPPELEIDGSDDQATGVVVYENKKPVATGRLILENGEMTIGRVAVLKECRGQGLGDLVVRMLIRRAVETGYAKQIAHAQTHARGFYAKLGFYEVGEEYYDAGILHITMVHEGDIGSPCC